MVTSGVLAVIPARGGSKSVPRKNVRPLGGLPLLAYSIEAGLNARLVDRVLVSTDDDDIAEIARRYGANAPFLRPAELSGDLTPDWPVFVHALDWLARHKSWTPEIVVQLRPTSPLRPPGLVDEAIARLLGDPDLDSVRTVMPATQNPFKMWRLPEQGSPVMVPLLDAPGGAGYDQPRQSLPSIGWQTGHVDATRTRVVRAGAMTGPRVAPLMVDAAYGVDIDTEADWRQAEWRLAHFTQPLVRPAGRDLRLPARIRLVVFDFDGVMTDNRVWVDGDGHERVACHRGDGLGLSQLREAGVPMLVLSTEQHPVVSARCRKLGLECVQGASDKAARLRELLAARAIDPADVVYVGNDVNDLGCLALAGCGVAVADAHPTVLAAADLVLERRGGDGAVRELCERIDRHLTGDSR